MNLHFFHSWQKWSKPKVGDFEAPYNPITQEPSHKAKRAYQERFCNSCGKHQWRII